MRVPTIRAIIPAGDRSLDPTLGLFPGALEKLGQINLLSPGFAVLGDEFLYPIFEY